MSVVIAMHGVSVWWRTALTAEKIAQPTLVICAVGSRWCRLWRRCSARYGDMLDDVTTTAAPARYRRVGSDVMAEVFADDRCRGAVVDLFSS